MAERISRYELLERLGAGGMGVVYRARDTADGSIVALKLLQPLIAADPQYTERFRREARIAREVDSDHVVRLLDAGEEDGRQFLVMEFITGQSLDQYLKSRERLSISETLRVGSAVVAGLAAVNARGIIHRDISPQNVMLSLDGRVLLTDFGIARDPAGTSLTVTSALMGKPGYMAPEVVQGEAADVRSDIYAMGVVLYEMLAGEQPFKGPTPYAVMQMQMTAPPPPLRGVRSDLPEWLAAVVERCLEKSSEARYQTPVELLEALSPPKPPPPSLPPVPEQREPEGPSEPEDKQPAPDAEPSESEGEPQEPEDEPTVVKPTGPEEESTVVWPIGLEDGQPKPENLPVEGPPKPEGKPEESEAERTVLRPAEPESGQSETGNGRAIYRVQGGESPPQKPKPKGLALAGAGLGVLLVAAAGFLLVGGGDDRASGGTQAPGATSTRAAQSTATGGPAATPTQPATLGATGRIAYASGDQIYVMNADGTGQTQLTTEGQNRRPDWSPDGSRIVFQSGSGDNLFAVYVMNADGTGKTRLAAGVGPKWSPDGRRIAFHGRFDGGEIDQIYVINVDGTGRTQITSEGSNFFPSWSPDGSRIAFTSTRDGARQVYVMNADGTGQTRLTTEGANQDPVWSPDGSRIVFSSYRASVSQIWLMNPDGSGAIALTTIGSNFSPSWSPDGSRIAFHSDRSGPDQIFVMRADGSGQTRLTVGPEIGYFHSWTR